MVETINGIQQPSNPVHVEAKRILELAEKPKVIKSTDGVNIIEGEVSDKRGISLIRNFDENSMDSEVKVRIENLIGFPLEKISEIVKNDINGFKDVLSQRKLSVARKNSMEVFKGGDQYLLNPRTVEEKNKKENGEGTIELLAVKKIEIDGKKGESVIVYMEDAGSSKISKSIEGNPNNQIQYEMFKCLKGKISVIIAKNIEDHDGLMVAEDNGTRFDLNPGDVLFMPLNTSRQVIPNNGDATNLVDAGAYYFLSQEWKDETIEPCYWPEQVK